MVITLGEWLPAPNQPGAWWMDATRWGHNTPVEVLAKPSGAWVIWIPGYDVPFMLGILPGARFLDLSPLLALTQAEGLGNGRTG